MVLSLFISLSDLLEFTVHNRPYFFAVTLLDGYQPIRDQYLVVVVDGGGSDGVIYHVSPVITAQVTIIMLVCDWLITSHMA